MNFDEVCQNFFKIFENKEINYELFEELKQEKILKLKATYKIYLIDFFIDPEIKNVVKNKNDFWFINENIYKYIELMIKLIQTEDMSSIYIYKELEIFINTEIGKRVLYIISIINRLNSTNNIYLLFVGFILGEKRILL